MNVAAEKGRDRRSVSSASEIWTDVFWFSKSSRNFSGPPADKNPHILVSQLDSKILFGTYVGSGAPVLGVCLIYPSVASQS